MANVKVLIPEAKRAPMGKLLNEMAAEAAHLAKGNSFWHARSELLKQLAQAIWQGRVEYE